MEARSEHIHLWQTVSPDGRYWAFSIFLLNGEYHYTVLCAGGDSCHGITKIDELVNIVHKVKLHYCNVVDSSKHYIIVWISERCREIVRNE
jgi:hypothetical protein